MVQGWTEGYFGNRMSQSVITRSRYWPAAGTKPIDVTGLRSFEADEGRDADMKATLILTVGEAVQLGPLNDCGRRFSFMLV